MHDLELKRLITRAARGGPSVLALLVGDSTIGKTRALYEALSGHEEVSRWPLAAPADADELVALLGTTIAPGTVLWLDEIQKYLYGVPGAKAARELNRLLGTTGQIIVVGTIWQTPLTELTARNRPGDANADVRMLLHGSRTFQIPVPDHLTGKQRLALADDDPRLAEAEAMSGEDGRVIQHLTGGPELLDAYGGGGFFTPAEHALITAAIDARRLGHYQPVSAELLAAAADGYLSPGQRPGGKDWAVISLTSITSGDRPDGSVTDIRTLTALRTHRAFSGQPDPGYEPDGFLSQHVGDSRHACLGPPALWDALAAYGAPADLHRLGEAARRRGLYRHAALLWYRAAADGDTEAAIDLIEAVRPLGTEAVHSACMWVVEHAPLDDPWYTGELLSTLGELGAAEAIAAFIARDPVSSILPDDLGASGRLLTALHHAGAATAVTALLARDPAARFVFGSAIDDGIYELISLLRALTETYATSAVTEFSDRIARQLPVENADWELYPFEVMSVLEIMRKAGQTKAVGALAARVALHFPLDDGLRLASVLRDLHGLGAVSALETLANRAARKAPPGSGIADVINALRETGPATALAALAERAARQAPVAYTPSDYLLLVALHDAGASDELAVLANRVALDDPASIAWLLDDLTGVGEDKAVQVLLFRDPAANVCLTDGTGYLLSAFRDAGADDAVHRLLSRSPASQIQLDDPAVVAWLLDDLVEVGADAEKQALLSRNPAGNVPVQAPGDVSYLLDALYEVGAHDAAAVLADRAARGARLAASRRGRDIFGVRDVIRLLESMSSVGTVSAMTILAARAARELPVDDERHVIDLLEAFRRIDASEATAILLAREPEYQVVLTGLSTFGDNTLADVLEKVGARDAAELFSRREADVGLHGDSFAKLVKRLPRDNASEQLLRFGREPD